MEKFEVYWKDDPIGELSIENNQYAYTPMSGSFPDEGILNFLGLRNKSMYGDRIPLLEERIHWADMNKANCTIRCKTDSLILVRIENENKS